MRTVLLEDTDVDTVADTQVSLMGAKQELIEVRKQLAVSEANQSGLRTRLCRLIRAKDSSM